MPSEAPRTPPEIVVLGCGVVSPWGLGLDAVGRGLLAGDCRLVTEHFDGLGSYPVGRCAISLQPTEDRAHTLLRVAFDNLRPLLDAVSPLVPPDRRAISCASSKGAFDLITRQGALPHTHQMIDMTADAPCRWLANWWEATGPVAASIGACSTGLLNVLQGERWLRLGMADLVLCGSIEGALVPLYLTTLSRMGALASEACRPYDIRHDGFVPGEGAGLFLLATGELAARCGIHPLANLDSCVSAGEAHHETALAPDGTQVERLIRLALRQARLTPGDLDLLCAHGTATVQGDRAEAAGLDRVWPDGTPPPLFSVKGAIGHLMGASGSVELAACLAAIREGIIPSTVGFEKPAPECLRIPARHSTTRGTVRRVLKWSLGFGGAMAAVILSAPRQNAGSERCSPPLADDACSARGRVGPRPSSS